MTNPHSQPKRAPSRAQTIAYAILSMVAVCALIPASALGSPALRLVRFHGERLVVPASWPVLRLARDPSTCVRFNRHAVYLGTPGADQLCPPHAAGRTEAILVSPSGAGDGAGGATLEQPAIAGATPALGSVAELTDRRARVVVTATWGRDPGLVARALGLRSVAALIRLSRSPAGTVTPVAAGDSTIIHGPLPEIETVPFSTASPAAVTPAAATPAAVPPTAVTPPVPAQPGAVFTGLGFDACSAPSGAQMTAWSASPYRALGVYIGGAEVACPQSNLTAAWVSAESAAGWHLIPTYVGLQAPGNSCRCAAFSAADAAAQGTAAAVDAVEHAQALGIGTGNPIYFDLEAYTRGSASPTVLEFLSAWTVELHFAGYLSGVYSSADSGIADLVSAEGSTYTLPDVIWIADWNNEQTTADAVVPVTEWAAHQRLHQYRGGHTESYDHVTIDIDGDYVDAATAAAGAAAPVAPAPPPAAVTPSLTVSPASDGTVQLSASWAGMAGIASWQVLAGAAPTALTPEGAPIVGAAGATAVVKDSYPYFAVQALGPTGVVLGTSVPVATPSHVAIFGQSAFVSPTGVGGLPIGCAQATACEVTTTISAGRRTLARTGLERIGVGGGLDYFSLTPTERTALARAADHRLPVMVHVAGGSGESASRLVNLVAFSSSGPSPARSLVQTPALRIVGATDFVSHGWVGGILAGCFAGTPCEAKVTLSAGGRVIGSGRPTGIGVNELGYVMFSLTRAGHRLLATAGGHQIGARLTLTSVAPATSPVPTAGGSGTGTSTTVSGTGTTGSGTTGTGTTATGTTATGTTGSGTGTGTSGGAAAGAPGSSGSSSSAGSSGSSSSSSSSAAAGAGASATGRIALVAY
jgi:hypothetical protein